MNSTNFNTGFVTGLAIGKKKFVSGGNIPIPEIDVEWQPPDWWDLPEPASNQVTAFLRVMSTDGYIAVNIQKGITKNEFVTIDWGDGNVETTPTLDEYGTLHTDNYFQHNYSTEYMQQSSQRNPFGFPQATITITYDVLSSDGDEDGYKIVELQIPHKNFDISRYSMQVIGLKYGDKMCIDEAIDYYSSQYLQYIKMNGRGVIPSIDTMFITQSPALLRIDFNSKETNLPNLRLGYNSNLQTVNGLENLTELTKDVFEYDIMLQKIDLPNCISITGDGAFYECTSLKEINMPKLETITGVYAFETCSALVDVNFPSLHTIDLSNGISTFRNCFSYCTNLRRFNAPNLTSIEVEEFRNCYMLKELYVADGCNFNGNTFSTCYNLDPKPK